MCGIAGIVTTARVPGLDDAIRRMIASQFHRGPDDGGTVVLGDADARVRVALGNRRLAIIDLSAAGHQPMASEDGAVWVVYNGEVYNFAELRSELIAHGYCFRSRTDTEVLIHGYRRWGIDGLLARLQGMFAFAIWDAREERLMLVRDRLGEKPLYFAWDGSTLVFASELRAILASRLVERRLDPAAAVGYLTWGSVPAPLSIVRGVDSLMPGCMVALERGRLVRRRYWELSFDEDRSIDERAAAETTRELLAESVRARLVGDVPVGIFLSGGMDSSALVALACESAHARLRTFSVVFDENDFDEGPYAERVAAAYQTEHTALRITSREVLNELPRVVWAMDQPTNDGVNTYFVSQATRRAGTVVALSGLGGDELFGGYQSFWMVPRLRRLAATLGCVPGARAAASWMISSAATDRRGAKLASFVGAPFTPERAYLAVRGLMSGVEVRTLLDPDLYRAGSDAFDAVAALEHCAGAPPANLLNRVSQLELRAYMHNQLLRDTDAMSMAHSLEVRAPFLDHRLVEFVTRVPAAINFNGRRKSLLAKALGWRLPDEVVRRPKRGFTLPFDRWLRSTLRPMVEDWIASSDGEQVLNPAAVRALWRSFLDGEGHWSRVWAVVAFKWWVRDFMRGNSPGMGA